MSPEVRRRRRSRGLRRLRRMVRERPAIPALAGVFLVVALGVGFAAWRILSVAGDLEEVGRNGEILRAALVRGDAEGARIALGNLQEASEDAESGTNGVWWPVFERLPLFGDDAEGVRVAAEALADIAHDGLPPLVDAAEDVTAQAFHPRGGTFPLDRIARLEEPAVRSEAAFAGAVEALGAVDSDGFYGSVRLQYDALETLATDARVALGAAARAAQLLPAFLGAEGPRDHLLVMQNNAEIRSSGGLPGSLSMIHAEGGRVEIVEQLDMAELEGTTEPVLPLDAEELQLFGDELGIWGVDATLTPDFPRAADLIRERWETQVGGDLDGILFVDPVAVSYLLAATGPIDVPGYTPVGPATVVPLVENHIYASTVRPAEHSDYQNAVAKAIFGAFTEGQGNPADVIRGLAAAVSEGRVRMHSFNAAEQEVIAGTTIAGEFPAESDGTPRVGIYLNDAGETKMSYYLRQDSTFAVRDCRSGVQDLLVALQLTSETPPDVESLPPSVLGFPKEGRRIEDGQQLVVAYVMSPVGGRIVEIDYGSGWREPAVQEFRGREVATVEVRLDPREVQSIEARIRSGRGQTGDPELFVTPGSAPGSQSKVVHSAC